MNVDPYQIASEMTCPNCGARVDYVSNDVIYGRPYGAGFAYICSRFPACDSFVGIHGANAGERHGMPLGTLANKETRSLRHSVHNTVDTFWQTKRMTRKEVYAIISKIVDLPIERTHVGEFNAEQCKKVLTEWFNHVEKII